MDINELIAQMGKDPNDIYAGTGSRLFPTYSQNEAKRLKKLDENSFQSRWRAFWNKDPKTPYKQKTGAELDEAFLKARQTSWEKPKLTKREDGTEEVSITGPALQRMLKETYEAGRAVQYQGATAPGQAPIPAQDATTPFQNAAASGAATVQPTNSQEAARRGQTPSLDDIALAQEAARRGQTIPQRYDMATDLINAGERPGYAADAFERLRRQQAGQK